MKKQSLNILVWLVAFFTCTAGVCDAYAAQKVLRTREDVAKLRAENPRKKAPKKSPAMRVHAGDKQLYAMHCSAYDGDLYDWSGVVKVLEGATCPEPVHQIDGVVFQGTYMNGKIFVVLYDAYASGDYVTYQVYDAETWELEATVNYTATSPNILPYGLTYDHTTGKVYGSFFADTSSFMVTDEANFGVIDFSNAFEPVSIIAELPERMRAMTVDAEGELYAMSFGGDMYKINKFTGEAAETGVHVDLPTQDEGNPCDPWDSYGRESMCCDWESGDFFISYSDDIWNSYVARFNPTTGDAEIVADYSYSDFGSLDCNILTGLYFEQKAAAPSTTTPAAVAEVTVKPVGTELKAEVTFTMPTTDSEGNDLDTDLTWSVSDGNNELATGTAHTGEDVTVPVELTAGSGRITLVVTTSLNGSVSNPATGTAFFGCDTPAIYGLPTVRAAGNTLTVKWDEAYAVNGGNLDPVTYKVTRMPDEVVVAEAHETTTFVDEITSDIKTTYYYIIEPRAGEVAGEPVTSRSVVAGKYIGLPLDEQFDDEQRFLQYPVIDANGDDNIWEYSTRYNGVAVYPANNNTADDYLLIGPFKMEAGMAYSFHMTADGHNFKERIAVYVGTDADDVNSFSTELLAPSVLDPMKGESNFNLTFEPETAGDYYFGIKACTEGASQYIYVYNVNVKAMSGKAPAAPVDMTVAPAATSATITFTLSDKCIDGSDADDLTVVNIYRDNSLIGTLTENVAPGAELSFTDEDADVSKGYHYYAVTAVNDEGEGKSSAAQVWRGMDFPGRPSNVRFWEDLETPGMIHVTFDAPDYGYYGGYYNPEETTWLVNYLVMGSASGVIEMGKGTEQTFTLPMDVTSQDIFGGSIYGRNSEGAIALSGNWATQVCYIGPALDLPLHESWPGQTTRSGIWGGQSLDGSTSLGESYWDVRDGSAGSVNPQDADAGMMALTVTADGGGKRVLSPRVSVKDVESPAAVFYYLYTDKVQEFNLEILVDDQPVTTLQPLDLDPARTGEWIRMEVPLSDYKTNRYIQLAFSARGLAGEDVACIDNVTLSDLKTNDLSVTGISAPAKVDVNGEATLKVNVRNNGSKTVAASDFTVVFYKNDEVLAEVEGKEIAPDGVETFSATDCPTPIDPNENVYYAEVVYAADMNPADNTTSRAIVRVIIPDYPGVTDLNGEYDNGVVLTWSDPDMSLIPGVSTTETFESYESFIIDNIGPWSVYDGDKFRTVIMATTLGILEYPHIGEPMAWQVFDPLEANLFHSAWDPRSGSKMLVSFQASADEARECESDDWLISPELNGAEQVISFYARAGHATYAPEMFDFMVSDKTDAVDDFTPMASGVDVPYTSDGWIEYTYRVPAGTRYFAIVHKSFNKLAMLVDDITYIPAGSAPVQLDLEGFNIYRDGKRLNDEPVGDNTYTDTDVVTGEDYTYCVSAVYDKGETAVSEPVTIKAVSSVDATVTYELTISAYQGFIRIEGGIGEQAMVFSVSGTCVASVKAEGTVDIPVAPGIYVVRAGAASAKVEVR